MTTVIIQARMGSSRLPGKVLRPLGGRPVLAWVVRAATVAEVGPVVVVTSTAPEDDAVSGLVRQVGAAVVRGSESDVLARFIQALIHVPDEEIVVRLTGDCPLLDPALIRMAVSAFASGKVDYLSTALDRTLPRGEDVEVTTAGVLRAIDREAEGADRVHVTSRIYRTPGRSMAGLVFQPRGDDLRITLDTAEDAALLDAVVARLGDRPPSWQEVVALLRAEPALAALNANVRAKEIDEG